jgi:limonene-1,2-epoxide hydrolase
MTETTSAVDTTANARIVETFLYALQDEDFDTAEALVSEGLIWQNVGWTKLFRSGEGRAGLEVKIHHIATDGSSVLTERTDALIFGPLRLQFWVCGSFDVQDGRITVWRDYLDAFDFFVKAPLRGLAAIVVPSLRQSF